MSTSDEALRQFMEHMNRIVRDVFQSFGGPVAFQTVATPGRDTGYRLQQAVIRFAAAWQDPRLEIAAVTAAAKEVESQLLVGHSLGIMNDKAYDAYIDELYTVFEQRTNDL